MAETHAGPPPAPTPGGQRGWRHLRTAALAVWLAVTWLSLLVIPFVVAPEGLDPSWVLVNADDLARGLRAGTDTVFVHGPLGYLTMLSRVYCGDLFHLRVAVELVLKLICAAVLATACLDVQGWLPRLALLAACLLLTPCGGEGLYLTVVALAGVRGVRAARLRPLPAGVLVVAGAVLALGKFTLLLQIAVTLVLVAVAEARRGRWRSAAALGAGFGVAGAALWLAAGQSLLDLPRYLTGALQLAAGHGEGMMLADPGSDRWWVIGVAAVLAALLATAGRSLGWLAASVLALGAALAWKQSIVRQDPGHLLTLLVYAAPALVLAGSHGPPGLPGRARRLLALVTAGVAVQAALAFWHRTDPANARLPGVYVERLALNARILGHLGVARPVLEAGRQRLAETSPSRWLRDVIGDRTVDAVPTDLAPLLLQDLHLRHRPVFQGYLAYTPALQERNEAFYASDAAPDFVVFGVEPIDGRPPLAADGLVQPLLLARYRLVRRDGERLLLERRPEPVDAAGLRARSARRAVLETRVALGTWVELGSLPLAVHELSCDVRASWLGRLRALLYQPAELRLWLRTGGGATEGHRIGPALVRAGFVADPVVRTTADFAALMTDGGASLDRVTAVCVTVGAGAAKYFEPSCAVSLWRREGLPVGQRR